MDKRPVPSLPESHRRLVLVSGLLCQLPMLIFLPPWLAVCIAGVALLALFSPQAWPAAIRFLGVLALGIGTLYAYDFGLGRDTASAGLLAMLALKFAETRDSRDARSVLGFSLFAPFAAFLQSQDAWVLMLAALCIPFWMLSLRAVDTPHRALDWRQWLPQGKSLLRTLAVAVPLALAGFWLFPRLASPLWGMPNNAAATTGISDRMRPGQWIDLFADDNPAFRVKFEGSPTLPAEKYWRGPVLWNFDGQEWTRSYMARNLPAAELESRSPDIVQRIWMEPTEQPFLFALDVPMQVEGARSVGFDRSAVTRDPITQTRAYRATSSLETRFDVRLPETLRQAATALPEGFNPRTRALAQRWRSEARDDAEYVQRVLRWINAEFTYSLDAPLLGRDGMDQFLFDSKIGYCEYFSSAFVVLMREAGIPSRVVTGYAGGIYNPIGDFWLIRNSDAHAWAEIWLEGQGWKRVDPTAAVAPERVFETVEDLRNAQDADLFSLKTAGDYRDWLAMAWNDWMLGFDAQRQKRLLTPFGEDGWGEAQSTVLIAFGFAFALALSLWLLLRERDASRDALLRAWDLACARLGKLGYPRDKQETARDFAARVQEGLAAGAGDFAELADRFNTLRYARAGEDEAGIKALIVRLRAYRPKP